MMRKFRNEMLGSYFKYFCISMICVLLCFSICSCRSSTTEDLYHEYYYEGYNDGYEDGWDEAVDIIDDEIEVEKERNKEILRLLFESVYNGRELEDGVAWNVGNFSLRYHLEENEYLYFDIKFEDFDIKTICNNLHNYIDNIPVTCYVGMYDEQGQYTTYRESFVGENIFLYDNFEFTSDGYLTDFNIIDDAIDTIYILIFVNGEIHAATYSLPK